MECISMKIFVSFTIIFTGQTSCSWAFTLSTEVFSSAAAFEKEIISSASARYTILTNRPEVSGIASERN